MGSSAISRHDEASSQKPNHKATAIDSMRETLRARDAALGIGACSSHEIPGMQLFYKESNNKSHNEHRDCHERLS